MARVQPILANPSYRLLYFSSPKIRTDGIYICRLTYYRPGQSEEGYLNPIHHVVYYRYLRFFGVTDGFQVISLVSTDEPKQVIDRLRRIPETTSQNSNMFVGRYFREFDPEMDTGIRDRFLTLHLRDPASNSQTHFNMVLYIKPQKSPYAHSILICQEYSTFHPPSLNAPVGDTFQLDVSLWGKFHFSKVRSYHT